MGCNAANNEIFHEAANGNASLVETGKNVHKKTTVYFGKNNRCF